MATEAQSLIERLGRLDSGAVSDALDIEGLTGVASDIQRRTTRETVCGRVRTMKLVAGTPAKPPSKHLGVSIVETGTDLDVIVVEQRTGIEAAGWGGVLSHAAKLQRIRGVIVDGPIRDLDEIAEVGLPVFSRSVTPRTARGRIYEQAVDVPVAVGDCLVNPGDYVIADGTGVVFVPGDRAESVIDQAEQIASRESVMSDALHEGAAVGDVMGRDYETMLDRKD